MFSWSVMASTVGCTITMYLFVRYVLPAGLGIPATIMLLFALLLIGCVQPLSSYAFEKVFGKFYPFYRYALYFLFVGCVILMCLTLISDIIWFTGYKFGWFDCLPFDKNVCGKMNAGLLLTAFLLTCYALYEGIKVPAVREITLVSDKITQDKKIVVLSDIHIHRVISPEKVRHIVARTNALNPDIILLVGDIVDDAAEVIAKTTNLLRGLKAKQGIYFVSGNHEFYAGYRDSLVTMERMGFKVLENTGVDLGEIYLAGIPDWRTAQRTGLLFRPDTALAQARDNQFSLLMSHTPANFGKDNPDLIVSGHTHGGQIFPFHILSSWHNKYLSGLYNIDNGSRIYVSRGAGQWGPQMRLLAPSEITLINLVSKHKKEKKDEL